MLTNLEQLKKEVKNNLISLGKTETQAEILVNQFSFLISKCNREGWKAIFAAKSILKHTN